MLERVASCESLVARKNEGGEVFLFLSVSSYEGGEQGRKRGQASLFAFGASVFQCFVVSVEPKHRLTGAPPYWNTNTGLPKHRSAFGIVDQFLQAFAKIGGVTRYPCGVDQTHV